MEKDDLIEKHLRLEMKDVYSFRTTNDEILHQLLTSYILSRLGIKRSRILSDYYYTMSVFLN